MSRVEVAAAVLLKNDEREFLLARRPQGKVYAGYWEFPGGKMEAGETAYEALVRELQEELGIVITAATPWLTRDFVYPHAAVRLHFWRVSAWEGDIRPLEHSAIAWQTPGETITPTPLLPANGPILKALALPTVMAITHFSDVGEDVELARLETAAARGIRLFQIRENTLPPAERAWFADSAVALVRPGGATILINEDAALAAQLHAGLHLSSASLRAAARRPPDFRWVGASCHQRDELEKAARLEFDYALLGPVLPTPSHPESAGLGWEAFARLVQNLPLPVFAVGGMTLALKDTAQAHGAHGIALMRHW